MFFVCCNIIGSLELVLLFGMVRSTSPELGARGNAKRGLGSLEMLRGDFISFFLVYLFTVSISGNGELVFSSGEGTRETFITFYEW